MAMKSSEYWKKREAENAMKNQISEVQYKKDIEEIYANMMDEINKSMEVATDQNEGYEFDEGIEPTPEEIEAAKKLAEQEV